MTKKEKNIDLISSFPNVGIIIYQDKIVFSNKYVTELLGYTKKELYKLKITDIIRYKDMEEIEKVIDKRLRGEKFSKTYESSLFLTKKDGSLVPIWCVTDTVLYQGKHSGFAMFNDYTKQKYTEQGKEILKEINKIITMAKTEEEIFERICVNLVEKYDLKFVWAGIVDRKKKKIVPYFKYGKKENLLDVLAYDIYPDQSYTAKAVLSGEVAICADMREYKGNKKRKEELINRKFLSVCTIPVFKEGKVFAVIKLYSEFPNYFNELNIDVIKEIQNDISFALENVERNRFNTIISESIKSSDASVIVVDEKGSALYVNEVFKDRFGYGITELNRQAKVFESKIGLKDFFKKMCNVYKNSGFVTSIKRKDNKVFHVEAKIIEVSFPGNIKRFVIVFKDISEMITLMDNIQKLQMYDNLTGLLNMNGFIIKAEQTINEENFQGCLSLIDIYDMSYINKIYGFLIGDKVLVEFAKRIQQLIKGDDLAARISADTFGILKNIESSEDIYELYIKLQDLCNFTLQLGSSIIPVNLNASVVLYPQDGKDFKSIFERADITIKKCKKLGPGIIQFFDAKIEKETEKNWNTYTLIKRAVEEKLFVFYYQPYFYAKDLKVAGMEALVRIVDKNKKIYFPDTFIDYLENSHFLRSFDSWAISEIQRNIQTYGLNFSLNISGKTFNEPHFLFFIDSLPQEILDKLVIEITERVFIHNPERTMEVFLKLKELKKPPKIAIDDFGTGYSSMKYLKDLPVDIIKIDKYFTQNMLVDPKSRAIVEAIVVLSQKLGKQIIAEGVETYEQFEILKETGCNMVQGYCFAKPSELRNFIDLLKIGYNDV